MKKALIVGSTGQDGSYLYNLLNKLNYQVLGVGTKTLQFNLDTNLSGIGSFLDISNKSAVFNLLKQYNPNEIYYLAAYHHSSEDKKVDNEYLFKKSFDIHVQSLIIFLEGIKQLIPETKLFYAASSHIFGDTLDTIQNETTAFKPNCVYGITKSTGIYICHYYRENCSLFASVGILYNHESPLRSSKFVTKKIIETAIKIKYKLESKLVVGDLSTRVDWGFAQDYVEAMYKIIQLEKADDFIIASGKTHSIKDFIQITFNYLDLDWSVYVEENPSLIKKKRKKELQGDYSKLHSATGWKPKTSLSELIKIMLDEELKKYAKE